MSYKVDVSSVSPSSERQINHKATDFPTRSSNIVALLRIIVCCGITLTCHHPFLPISSNAAYLQVGFALTLYSR